VSNTIEDAIIQKMLVFEKVRFKSNDRQVRKKLAEIETVKQIDGDMKIKQIKKMSNNELTRGEPTILRTFRYGRYCTHMNIQPWA